MAEQQQQEELEAPNLGWDGGVDFNLEKVKLEMLIEQTRDGVEKALYSIALIQLVNGLRRHEAVEAAIMYAKHGKKLGRVRVQKRKDKYMRLVVIPQVVRRYESIKRGLAALEAVENRDKKYYRFCRSRLAHNTHSMRYAFISDASIKNPALLISKMTGQVSANTVLHYLNQKTAEKAFLERFKE